MNKALIWAWAHVYTFSKGYDRFSYWFFGEGKNTHNKQKLMIVWKLSTYLTTRFSFTRCSLPMLRCCFIYKRTENLFRCENWWDTFICNSIFIFNWFMTIYIKNHLLNRIVAISFKPHSFIWERECVHWFRNNSWG